MNVLELHVAFSSYWLHAHGEGGGADFDLVMERDDEGFPTLRGRHITGLLRLALLRAENWGWLEESGPAQREDGQHVDKDVTELLLGEREAAPVGEANGGPGCLAISDARLSEAVRAKLADKPDLIAALFARIPSAAIEKTTGVAKTHHLRTVEAAVPVRLVCPITFEPSRRRIWTRGRYGENARIDRAESHWKNWIELAWPALDEAGAKRTRGFGRLSWREVTS